MKRTAKSFPIYLDYSKAVNKLSDAEAGQLFKALLEYADSGQEPQLEGGIYAVFAIMQNQLDRDTEKYVRRCEQLRQNGSKGGRPAKDKEPNGNQEKPNGYSKKPKKPDTDTDTVTVTDTVTDSNIESTADRPPAPTKPTKKSYGEFGWVKLNDEEYARLINDLGEAEVKRCITYIDESAQTTGNKNKWRDWNLVIRKCSKQGWGLNQRQPQQNPVGHEHGVDRLARMYREEFG